MRVAFLGSPPFATEVFASLVEGGIEVVGLVTAPPRSAGRGRKQASNPLVEIAEHAGIPILRPESARGADFKKEFALWRADVGVVASYGQILDAELLATPVHGCLNLHGSLLPRWRGASPIQAALLAGDVETGVSVQRMVLALDAGSVIAESSLPIGPRETAPQLFDRLVEAGADLMLRVMQQGIEAGEFPAGKVQDESEVTVCRRIHKNEGMLDWAATAVEVDRRVRAMAGWPCALTSLQDGVSLKIHAGYIAEVESGSSPGAIVSFEDGIVVACGDFCFCITELQRPGKGRMMSADFLRGISLQVGDRFGEKA